MSLEAWGDEGPSEISAEDLERAGWSSDPDGKIWWKHEGEEMSFADACEVFDNQRQEDLEDYIGSYLDYEDE